MEVIAKNILKILKEKYVLILICLCPLYINGKVIAGFITSINPIYNKLISVNIYHMIVGCSVSVPVFAYLLDMTREKDIKLYGAMMTISLIVGWGIQIALFLIF